MALATRAPIRNAAPELALPPLFTAVRLRELGDAFAHAQSIAAESGAGTLVHVGRFDVAEFALMCTAGFPEPLTFSWRVRRALAGDKDEALESHAGRIRPDGRRQIRGMNGAMRHSAGDCT
jgi:hypothetical protein